MSREGDFRDVHIPFHDYLGLVVEKVGSPSRLTLPLGENVRGAVAPIHGGVVATLIDVACAAAIGPDTYDLMTAVPVSTDLSLRMFRQPSTSPLIAEGTVVHRGSKVIAVECVVTDGAGKQVARGGGGYLLVTGFHAHAHASDTDSL
ncbi:MAG: putative thioesterase [Frankiales bacterium]|nr:putative thioesterase [Frankiales bacterium]